MKIIVNWNINGSFQFPSAETNVWLHYSSSARFRHTGSVLTSNKILSPSHKASWDCDCLSTLLFYSCCHQNHTLTPRSRDLALNFTVFNLALSFFSTLRGHEVKGQQRSRHSAAELQLRRCSASWSSSTVSNIRQVTQTLTSYTTWNQKDVQLIVKHIQNLRLNWSSTGSIWSFHAGDETEWSQTHHGTRTTHIQQTKSS